MESKTYEIAGRKFRFCLTLSQDELLGEIVHAMLTECPEALQGSAERMVGILDDSSTGGSNVHNLVAMSLDLVKVNAWIYKKKLARRILAILLVPEGKEFDEASIPELEQIMSVHASREIASEVIAYFFQRSGAFGIVSRGSSGLATATPLNQ